MPEIVDLIGDGIENPWNAKTMIDIANAFGSRCLFRDRKQLLQTFESDIIGDCPIELISCDQIKENYSPVLALENLENASDIYGFKLPMGSRAALIVGNEKFGIAHDMQQAAKQVLQIPMPGLTLNTLNVAAAAGVALYYLVSGAGAKLQVRSHPEKRRPDVLFMGVADHIELGSAIRSAGAFGWNRLLLEDTEKIWFGCNRITRSEGRGAARRGRNSIRVVPVGTSSHYAFRQVAVISTTEGIPINKANLAVGPQQLIVIADESQASFARNDWARFGANVQHVRIKIPSPESSYHYRLQASIALAESARQIGEKTTTRVPGPGKQGPIYDSSLEVVSEQSGEEVFLEDLTDY
jgi:SpoU rRNA Methylase family